MDFYTIITDRQGKLIVRYMDYYDAEPEEVYLPIAKTIWEHSGIDGRLENMMLMAYSKISYEDAMKNIQIHIRGLDDVYRQAKAAVEARNAVA